MMNLSGRRLVSFGLALFAFASQQTVAADNAEVELFAAQPVMVGARLSPDGTRIAFLSSLQGHYHLVIERFKPEFERSILSAGDELEFEWVHWANNERLVVSASFAARRYLAETTETRLLSVDSSAQTLTPIIRPGTFKETGSRLAKELPPPQIQDKVIDWLPDEPDHILVSVDANINGVDEIRRVDIRNGKYTTELTDFADRNWMTDQTGAIRLGWGYDDDDLVVTIKDTAGQWSDSKDRGWIKRGFVPVAFADDPNVLFVRGPNESGLAVVRKVSLETDEFLETIFEHDLVDAGGVVFDDSSGAAVGISYTEHLPLVEYFDGTMKKLQATISKALPDATNRIVSTSKDQRQILIFSYTEMNPGSYFVWDRDEKDLSQYSDYIPNIGEGLLSPVDAVTYEARDGLTIPAYLTIPRGSDAKELPTVVMPHGGPRARDDKSYWFLSQFLASRGYAVLQPNFRGSSGYGKPFADAGLSEWGGKMQDDVSDGAQWLIDKGIADANRLCIVGWSYGGYAAAMGAIKTPDLYQCAASINGVLNLPRHILDDRQYVGGTEWTRHMGLEGESSRAVSPHHQAERITIPMLIIQTEDDTRVHKDQGRGMADKLRSLNKQVEFVEIGLGGHSITNVEGRRKVLESLDAFLMQNIGTTAGSE